MGPLHRVAALTLGLLAALGAGELLARWAAPPRLEALVRSGGGGGMAQVVSDGRVFAGRPGYAGGLYALDAQGLRAVEGGAADGCSVVVLGDSVAFGHGVASSEVFGAEVARRTGAAVTNLAFPGWNTVQEAAALELHDGEPDVVVLVWVSNDVASLEWDHDVDGQAAMYVRHEVRLVPGLSEATQVRLWRGSAGWRLLSDALGDRIVVLEEREHREALAAIAARAEGWGAPVVFLQVPPFVDRAGWEEPWVPGRATQPHHREPAWRAGGDAARAHGWTVVDGTEAVAGSRPSELGLDSVHPNARGHARLGELLAPWVASACPDHDRK